MTSPEKSASEEPHRIDDLARPLLAINELTSRMMAL